jgi:hypothetical protein
MLFRISSKIRALDMVCRFSDNIFTGSEQDMVSDKVNRSHIKYAMSCTLVTEPWTIYTILESTLSLRQGSQGPGSYKEF